MNKEDLVYNLRDILRIYQLEKGDYIITYGAAMVLRDVRESCNDIDIALTCKAYDRIRETNSEDEIHYNNDPFHLCIRKKFLNYDHETINADLFRGSYGFLTKPVGTEMSNGYIVQTLVSLRNEKYKKGREKDIKDVKLLDEVIKRYNKKYIIN